MTTERYILEALQKAVTAAVAASTKPSLPIKYVGRTFKTPDKGGWLEVIYIPNNIDNEFWGSEKTYQGLFRLALHWIMDDAGAYTPMGIIESVASYFGKSARFVDPGANVSVLITDNPNLMGAIEEAPELLFPVSIRYQFFKTAIDYVYVPPTPPDPEPTPDDGMLTTDDGTSFLTTDDGLSLLTGDAA